MLFEIAAYDNDYEDQGMHECKCGVVFPRIRLASVPAAVLRTVRSFAGEYRLRRGRFSLYRFPGGIGLCWSERGNDRCFGIEISKCKPL